jgi:Phosphatidyl serine synthase
MVILTDLNNTFHPLQNKHQARQMLKFVYPELGVPLPDRSYAESCDLTMDNLKVTYKGYSVVIKLDHHRLNIHLTLESNRYFCLGPCSWLVRQGTYSSRLLVLLDIIHYV